MRTKDVAIVGFWMAMAIASPAVGVLTGYEGSLFVHAGSTCALVV